VLTERLSLGRLQDRDVDELADVFEDPQVWWFEYERGLNRAETQAFLDRQKRLWNEYGFGGCAVRDLKHRALLGVVGLGVAGSLSHPFLPGVTIGWRFGSSVWGQGFATEAAVALLQQAFGPMRIPAVGCVTNRENARSVNLARRLQMEVIAEQQVLRDDGRRRVDALLLRVDRSRWADDEAQPTAYPDCGSACSPDASRIGHPACVPSKHPPRYDEIADWYRTWVGDGDGLIVDGVGDLLPRPLTGMRVLDVACGHGRASRGLARLGAAVVGVDLSADLIASARAREDVDRFGITYHVADVTRSEQWWNGVTFDGAVCEMAIMDIEDLPGTIGAVAHTVRHDGWFVISMVHPCFPGNDAGLSSWPPDATYFHEGRWTSTDHNPDGVRIRAGSSHRTISTYLNGLIDAGFVIERLVEPHGEVPMLLLIACRRIT
jgi:RimJ/RimL family protein N-acetyltransferase/SAM-dependent methyltransferase